MHVYAVRRAANDVAIVSPPPDIPSGPPRAADHVGATLSAQLARGSRRLRPCIEGLPSIPVFPHPPAAAGVQPLGHARRRHHLDAALGEQPGPLFTPPPAPPR